MSWTDVQTWAALFVTIAATWVAVLARKDSKRSADTAFEALDLQRTETQAALDALALQRTEAQAVLDALALQQQEAEDRRNGVVSPEPSFSLISLHGHQYLLRNDGPGTAVNVQAWALGSTVAGDGSDPLVLRPGEGEFIKLGNWWRQPTVLHVKWEGQEHDVLLHVPSPDSGQG
ncbi:hypothetical protein AB5J72_12590 [Streptomyces sp. CG1]|uniref:hypothetical protein n=1 Tax=Streptomyces sp. CG1 TaxID=1287523 RepID=UPI0034E2942A